MLKRAEGLINLIRLNAFKNPLFLGSLVLYAGYMFTNLSGYFYHFLMARMLGVADYGALYSLISLLYLFGVPMGTFGLVIVKFSSSFKGQGKFNEIESMFLSFTRKSLFFSIFGLLIFILFTPFLVSFLHLESKLSLIIIGLIAFVAIFTCINRSFLQGILRFGTLSISLVIEAFLKISLSIILVLLGLKINGALIPILVGAIATYFFTTVVIKRSFNSNGGRTELDYQSMLRYAFPVFLAILAFTSLYTTDVVLVRHFFSAQEAGYYAALSTLGKVIFFATGPISAVMFPVISERHANGQNYNLFLLIFLLAVLLICLIISFIYWFFPELMIKLLFGKEFVSASSFLPLFALFLSFYSLSSLLTNFYLSIHKTKIIALSVLAALSQIFMITLLHQNLYQVVIISVVISALLFVSQMVYYCLGRRSFLATQ